MWVRSPLGVGPPAVEIDAAAGGRGGRPSLDVDRRGARAGSL